VCAPLLPEYDREGGSRRIFYLIELLREAGWAVTFAAENPNGDERYVRTLQQRGVAVHQGFGARTKDLFRFGRFDVAIFAFWYLAEGHVSELRRVSPKTKIIVDVIDLHWLRNARKHFLPPLRTTRSPGATVSDPDFSAEMVRELQAYAQADAVLTASDKEAETINDLLSKPSLAHTVPSHEESIPATVPFEDRRGILFIGNFNHPPNLDAVSFFCERILPRIDRRLLAEHPLSIVGQRPPQTVFRYAKTSPFVRVVGWVPSVFPYLQSTRVSVVPMRYGAGTKTKLLQALVAHTPTVTTTIGIEGLNVVPGRDVLLADDAASFARETERLLTDPELWTGLADHGSEQVAKLHSREAVRERLVEVLESKLRRPARSGSGMRAANP